ncbi:Nectin-3-like protein [Triplophysa tibetana]|uniref:Nectin cell adhesion molecule 3 n=1 Tax=Triplophysa tibetana TaxID=1572043 RepID=A0A5A9PEB9_9TELE|nr:Nectin-3-like protein [Triplophysa tibetana]
MGTHADRGQTKTQQPARALWGGIHSDRRVNLLQPPEVRGLVCLRCVFAHVCMSCTLTGRVQLSGCNKTHGLSSCGLRCFLGILTPCVVYGSQVIVPPKVNAVLGKNVTLSCTVKVDTNLSLTQSSWERKLPTGWVTLAVYNPMFGISVPPEYKRRLSFRSPSMHDATIMLEDVGFSDIGIYTCKVATFPLGNTQASTTISVLVEPKVYVSAGSSALIDGGNETTVATCIAERGRPPADVSWETDLYGTSEAHMQDDANGTTTTQVHYTWRPSRHAQGHILTCVVKHPALQNDFRIPYTVNVQWRTYNCSVEPKPTHLPSTSDGSGVLDGDMPEGAELLNNSLVFTKPLQKNDSGVYRCEVANDIGLQSRDIRIRVQDPPSTTTMPPTTPVRLLTADISATGPANKQRALITSPTLAPLPEGSLGTIVGGAVGGALFLLLLLILAGVYYQRQRRTFRGDYYTKQYHGPSDMQKAPQPHELQQVYNKDSPDTKPKSNQDNGTIYPDKDREEWGDFDRERSPNGRSRAVREAGAHLNQQNHHNHEREHNHQQNFSPAHHNQRSLLQPEPRRYPAPQVMSNGSPHLPEDCYDNDYVSHTDGSMISRREWYV